MTRQTSIEAYNKIRDNGLLSKRRFEVYDILFRHGPLTGVQVIKHYQNEYGTMLDSGSIKTRLSELRTIGVVIELGAAPCPVTGNNVIIWDVSEALPSKISQKEKLEKSITNTKQRLAKLESRLAGISRNTGV